MYAHQAVARARALAEAKRRQAELVREAALQLVHRLAGTGRVERVDKMVAREFLLGSPYTHNGRLWSTRAKSVGLGVYEVGVVAWKQ